MWLLGRSRRWTCVWGGVATLAPVSEARGREAAFSAGGDAIGLRRCLGVFANMLASCLMMPQVWSIAASVEVKHPMQVDYAAINRRRDESLTRLGSIGLN